MKKKLFSTGKILMKQKYANKLIYSLDLVRKNENRCINPFSTNVFAFK